MISISCIVPTYKRIDQTLKTLSLLFASDGIHTEFELEVIVSDSTPDDSLKLAIEKEYIEPMIRNSQPATDASSPISHHPSRVVYVRPDHEGIAKNKNAGAKVASHQILIFCDSDMEVEKNTLRETIEYLRLHPTVAMVGGRVVWKGGPKDTMNDRPRNEDRMVKKEDTTYVEALYSRYVATYKDIFLQVGGFDEEVFNMRGEGSDLSVRYWRAGFPLAFHENIIVHHVHDVPDAAAVRIDHAEWGIARDYLLLGYKYKMFEADHPVFGTTVMASFSPLGDQGSYRMLQGIGRNLDQIMEAKKKLDVFRQSDHPTYDFKFLEIFSNQTLFEECIATVVTRISEAHKCAFS